MAESSKALPPGALPEPALDADGRLLDELACRRCGYALRGLLPDGACPECETPIGRSIKGELLCYSDPEWIERVARGGRLLALSIFLFIALPIAALLLESVMRVVSIGLAVAIAKAVQVCGIWLATSPEPAMRDRETFPSARMIARWGSLTTGMIQVASAVAHSAPASLLLFWIPGATSQLVLRAAVDGAVHAIAIISIVALLMHARSFAFRLWDDKLWRQLTGVALVYALAFGTKALLELYTGLTGCTLAAGSDSLLRHLDTITRFVALITLVWCINLIFRFRRHLNEAAAFARETWARPANEPATHSEAEASKS